MIYLQLIFVYLKIGIFGFGGGYAMLSLIQDEVVVHHGWLTAQQFTDIVALSQVTPGPIGINSATYIGYTVTGSVWGSIVATLAVSFPSFILVMTIAFYYQKFRKNQWVEAAFTGIRPASVGLILAAALLLTLRSAFFMNLSPSMDYGQVYNAVVETDNFPDFKSIFIFAITFFLLYKKWVHPIAMIFVAGILGFVLYGLL